jgi:hypothetical protein
MTSDYTPGPWMSEGHIIFGAPEDEDGFSRTLVAEIINGTDDDVRLIAAAPEVYIVYQT